MRLNQRRIGLVAVAMVFAALVCEIAARIVFPAPPDPTRQPQIVYQIDPELRYILAPNQRGWIDDGFVTTNSLGFRGPEVALPKPAGRFRIVAIGDSLTFGWGVNDDETFCRRLEQLVASRFPGRDVDFVNLAVGGYNTRQEVGLLRRHVDRLQPDLVLVGLYSNDIPEAFDDKGAAADNGQAARVLHLNPSPTSWVDVQIRKSRALFLGGRIVKRLVHGGDWARSGFSMELDLLSGRDSAELTTAWQRVDKQFDDLRAMATADRFFVGLVMLPPREQVKGAYPNARYQSHAREIAERRGFQVIDPMSALAASETNVDALYIPYDRNHPSAAGHRVIAQAIFESLVGHGAFEPLARQVAGLASVR
jgi:lysophospholipase L1-like esterase